MRNRERKAKRPKTAEAEATEGNWKKARLEAKDGLSQIVKEKEESRRITRVSGAQLEMQMWPGGPAGGSYLSDFSRAPHDRPLSHRDLREMRIDRGHPQGMAKNDVIPKARPHAALHDPSRARRSNRRSGRRCEIETTVHFNIKE